MIIWTVPCGALQILLLNRYGMKYPLSSSLWLAGFLYGMLGQLCFLASPSALYAPLWGSTVVLFWQAVFLQDLADRTFTRSWFLWGLLFAVFQIVWKGVPFLSWTSFLIPALCLPFVWMQAMGSADAWFLLLGALVLDPVSFSLCFLCAVVTGLVWGVCSKDRLIPFASCLALWMAVFQLVPLPVLQ